MKNKLIFLILILCLMILPAGCTRNESVIGGADGPTSILIKNDVSNTGNSFVINEVITAINGTMMTIDGPDGCFNVPIQSMESSPEPQVGDILEVVYDGRIEELYPSLFPGIYSLKVHKPVEMTAVIADIGTYNDHDALYFNPVEFSSLNNCIVTDWMKYIPDGPTFEAGDEIVITYTGNVEEDNPAVLRGVVKIDLSHEGYGRKYGSESMNVLPPYFYSGKDPIEKAIVGYFEDTNELMKPEGSVWIPAFCIFRADAVDPSGTDAKKGDIKVYGNFWSFVYSKQGDILFCESGGEYPGVIYLKSNGGNDYEVTCFDRVGDGSKYSEEIKRISNGNEVLEKQYFSSADANSTEVKNKRTWNIYEYVKENGLDIRYYQDYGWDPVDFNMEVNSWGNVILENYKEPMVNPAL